MQKLIIFLFLSLPLLLKGQILLKQDLEKNILYVNEVRGKDTLLVDSISTLNMFNEYSFFEKNRVIYTLFSAVDVTGMKVYTINIYKIEDSIKLVESFYIEQLTYQTLFENGIKLSFSDKGLNIAFDKGKIRSIELGYLYINRHEVMTLLKNIIKINRNK